jgi:DNA-binding protein Alba
MKPKFQIYKDANEKCRFRILDGKNKIVASGEAYEKHASCLNGIKSIQRNCKSEIEDLTIEDRKVPNPKYQVYEDASGKYRFRLNASNGEVIADSSGFEIKQDCLKALEVVKNSDTAEIEDLAVPDSQNHTVKSSNVESTKTISASITEKSKTLFIGNKPPMNYVLAVIADLSGTGAQEIIVKARGRAITTAVDVSEIARNRYIKNLKVSKIIIGSQIMPPREGESRARTVSTIEIYLQKN